LEERKKGEERRKESRKITHIASYGDDTKVLIEVLLQVV
jgi:hypothetical protein